MASPFANLTGVTGVSDKGQASWSSPFLGPAWGSGRGTNTSASNMGTAGSVSMHPFAASSSASASAGNAAGGGFIFPAAAKEERAGGAEGVRTGSMQMQAPANHLGGVLPFGASFAASERGKASGINTVPAGSRWPQASAAPWNLSFSSFENPAGLSSSSLSSNSSIFGGGLAELVAQGKGISGQRFERGKPIFDLANGGGGGIGVLQQPIQIGAAAGDSAGGGAGGGEYTGIIGEGDRHEGEFLGMVLDFACFTSTKVQILAGGASILEF